ncbi:MAG: DUF4132 domain-containing protein [Burkholderiales bacterium]|nr:MAG: DUF4132 domain-containing protein [Burkholderiales bacterium]
MQRYELIEGASSKFWEVEVSGSELTVRFGRIGTAGQSKAKSFDDAVAATKERDKLIKEKTGKGYALISSSPASPSMPAAAVTPAKLAKPVTSNPSTSSAAPAPLPKAAIAQTPAAIPEQANEGIATETASKASSIVWPSGGFQWTKESRTALPVVRGIHVPPADPDDTVERLLGVMIILQGPNQWISQSMSQIAAAAGRTWVIWSQAESQQRITRAALNSRDFEFWLELMAQAYCSDGWGGSQLNWVTKACIALHGLPFTLEVVLAFWEPAQVDYRDLSGMLDALRQGISRADEHTYTQALETAKELRVHSFEKKRVCSHLFPHIAEWAVECLAQQAIDRPPFLLDCVLPTALFAQYVRKHRIAVGWLRPALYLQIHLHGSASFEALRCVLEQAMSDKHSTQEALDIITCMWIPELVGLLVSGGENKEVRAALEKLADQFPAAVLKTAIEHCAASRSSLMEGWTLRLAMRDTSARNSAIAELEPNTRSKFESKLAALQREDAPTASLPDVLRNPPWLGKQRQQELASFEVTALPTPELIAWNEQELAQAKKYEVRSYYKRVKTTDGFPDELSISAMGLERLKNGQLLLAGDLLEKSRGYESPDLLLIVPERSRIALWNSYPAKLWNDWSDGGAIRCLVAEQGVATVSGLLAYLQCWPDKGMPLVEKIDSPQLVDAVLHIARNLKKAKNDALAWLRRHPRTVFFKALPTAFAPKHSPARDNARHGICWLANQGFEALAREVAQAYGAQMPVALDALLSADPLLALPNKMPKLPSFVVPAAMRRPELLNGMSLPPEAVNHIAGMLTISSLETPYPGLQIVKDNCTPASMAELVWQLFDAWTTAGSPSKEAWAFTALGLLGDDETARRLAPKIRLWPGESAHARAVTGLDLLAAIGTDVALMHLNAIASKVKFKALQERAKEKISAVAEARGFTAEELADRLVPDLGLDEAGTLLLDFGSRQFSVGFDEALKPLVKDAQGVRLKDLPKPIKTDDVALAEEATNNFKQIKKDAKAIASQQVNRLEQAMVARRRWPVADFKLFFVEHPLMRHLAVRLVWGVYEGVDEGEVLLNNFRVAEDWTLADAVDTLYELPSSESLRVGISHILEMPKPSLDAFGQIFADYEILQPFKQLGRETYSLKPEEQSVTSLTRYKDKQVATGSVMGLVNRGWERGQAQDAGWVGEFNKRLGDDLQVDVGLEPGIIVGDMSYEPKQKLPAVTLRQRGSYDNNDLRPFSELHPIVVSEILRDLELLAVVKD